MSVEADGIEEALEGGLRVALTAAGRGGEHLAVRMQQLAVVRARNEQEAKELAGRLHVERMAARAQLAPVTDSAWWDRAGAREITQAYTTAKAWSGIDPDAERAVERIRGEVRVRYGVDVDAAPDRAALQARARARHDVDVQLSDHQVQPWERLGESERERAIEAEARRAAAPVASAEFLEAKMLMDMADRIDKDAGDARARVAGERDPGAGDRDVSSAAAGHTRADAVREDGRDLYDTAGRRQGFARELEGKGIDGEVVATRLRADVSQARPATEATLVATSNSPKARRTRAGHNQQLQHSGPDK